MSAGFLTGESLHAILCNVNMPEICKATPFGNPAAIVPLRPAALRPILSEWFAHYIEGSNTYEEAMNFFPKFIIVDLSAFVD